MAKDCLDYALNYINRFPKTKKELTVQLLKKGYNEDSIFEAMKWLEEKGYIDDVNFVRMYISSELIKKGKTVYVVKGKLLQKGVDKKIVEAELKKSQRDILDGQQKSIRKMIETYKKQGMDGFTIVQKIYSKGYSIDDIKRCL